MPRFTNEIFFLYSKVGVKAPDRAQAPSPSKEACEHSFKIPGWVFTKLS